MKTKLHFDTIEKDNVYYLSCNNKLIDTPSKNKLYTPTKNLVHHLKNEWEDFFPQNIKKMQLTSYCNTVIDFIIPQKMSVTNKLCTMFETDLLSYWEDTDSQLFEKQKQCWKPYIEKFEKKCDIKVCIFTGLMPQKQPQNTIDYINNWLTKLTPFQLFAIKEVADVSKSVILSYLWFNDGLSIDEVWKISQLDENYQAQKWGQTEEFEKKQITLLEDLKNIDSFVKKLN